MRSNDIYCSCDAHGAFQSYFSTLAAVSSDLLSTVSILPRAQSNCRSFRSATCECSQADSRADCGGGPEDSDVAQRPEDVIYPEPGEEDIPELKLYSNAYAAAWGPERTGIRVHTPSPPSKRSKNIVEMNMHGSTSRPVEATHARSKSKPRIVCGLTVSVVSSFFEQGQDGRSTLP